MLYGKREKFSRFDKNIGKRFSKLGLSPNVWTLLTLVFVVVTFYLIIRKEFLFAALFLALVAFMDKIDGSVARFTKRASIKGAYLDTIVDRYTEGILALGFLFLPLSTVFLPSYIWIFLYSFGSFMTTYAKSAYKEKSGKEIVGGAAERAERLALLFIGLVLASFDTLYLLYVIILLALLTNISALQRILIALNK